MSFSGTMDKCKACDKTVHFIDLLSADGVPYHKTCFKCSHCKGTLSMCTYSSMEGVLYCKPHFEQLFKETGSFTKKFPSGSPTTRIPSKLSALFSGTQDKCSTCKKTVYPLEKLSVEGEQYHKTCFKCSHGGCLLTTSNYAALQGTLYCKIHFAQLFKEKGCYNHLLKSASKKEMIVSTEEARVAAPVETEAPEVAPVLAVAPEVTQVVAEPLAA
ncbi:pollen-specific protein SF3-like protein [Carex littledalei]|uniref:Pollen-specific protein SF3-like protein n=1 Tax=Carex littledalei TaxID=544730 RepID=A0A833R039_9POAL|nr:pollen-specific protein SF3-like protein [Carex littledalei]